ncbi:MAG: hypothetical protein IJG60_07995 [Thermoguttaceae bacterium]|nr:hypothetical protein [Thermoguttaceae bacterium]
MKTAANHECLPGICVRLVLLLLFSLVPLTAYGNESQRDLLEVLKQGVDQQIREVEFKCTYTYSEYVVDTLEEAENFDTSNGRLVVHATGSLIKTKKMSYESFVLDTLKTKMPEYYTDHVTVTNPELRAIYVKQNLQYSHRTLFVSERTEEDKETFVLDNSYAGIMTPLTSGGGRGMPNYIDLIFYSLEKFPNETEVEIQQEGDYTKIFKNREIPDIEKSSSSFVISNSYPFPVLTERKEKNHIPKADITFYRGLKTSDYIRLNDGCVLPRRIEQYEPVHDEYGDENIGKWVVKKWESDDMGKEKPKNSDFYIYLDRDPDIAGLALNLCYKLVKNPPEYFDINKYSVRDLQTSSPIESQIDRKPELTVWIRPAIILVAGLLIIFGLWKKWKSARQSASA